MKRWTYCVLLATNLLAGCRVAPGRAEADAPMLPPVIVDTATVVAEGQVEPSHWVTLRAAGASTVVEVLVEEGDGVTVGSPIVRLDTQDALLGVQQAEATLAVAAAKVAELRAEVRPETLALMDAQVAAATAALSQSIAMLNGAYTGRTQAEIASAQADILAAQVLYDIADDAHDETMKCYNIRQEDGSKREICPALGTFEEMTRARMEAAWAGVEAMQAQLEDVQRTAGSLQAAARADVAVAEAQVTAGRAARDRAALGSRDEAVAVAEAAVDGAKAAVAAALAQLEANTVSMPFDGTVVARSVEAGDAVGAGSPLVTVAGLDALRIRTRDLTELDIVRVAVGQPAVVRTDARPDAALLGHVVAIEPKSHDYLGDVTYAVLLELDVLPAWLRWGMTVDVEIGEAAAPSTAAVAAVAVPGPAIAEAVVQPARQIEVGPQIAGEVIGIPVRVGSIVECGEPLLVLDDVGLANAVAEAQAAHTAAKAALALMSAGARAEETTEAEAEIGVAQAELARAVAQRNNVSGQPCDAQTAALTAALASAQAEKREIQAFLHWAEDDDSDERVAEQRLKLAAANQKIAAIELELAAVPRERATQLQVAVAAVHTAEANVAAAEAKLDLLEAGPTSAAIKVAEARVAQAAVVLARAEQKQTRSVVRAPHAGTVAAVAVAVGEHMLPGQPAITIGDLTRMELRTINLMEGDVVHVVPGQPVLVVLDAVPDLTLSGTVARVGLQYETYRGDITYPVTVALDEQPKALRWGMSAVVEF